LLAIHLPEQPLVWWKLPEPLRPEKRPDPLEVIWPLVQTEFETPFGLTPPDSPSPMNLPDEIMKTIWPGLLLHPVLVTVQVPSNLSIEPPVLPG
jgi:hypothetical protein